MRRILFTAIAGLLLVTSPAFAKQAVRQTGPVGMAADSKVMVTRAEVRSTAYAKRVTRKRVSRPKANNLENVCSKITNINGLLVKITAGGHIPRSDPRYSGFSIVCAKKCLKFPAKVYHCDGSLAFSMGYYGKWVGNGKSRGYCGTRAPRCPTSAVRRKSKSLGCDGAGYLATGGGSCMRFNLNLDRNGGV